MVALDSSAPNTPGYASYTAVATATRPASSHDAPALHGDAASNVDAPPSPVPAAEPAPVEHLYTHHIQVQPGENMALIFARLGLDAGTLHTLVHLNRTTHALKSLRPGDQLEFRIDSAGELHTLRHRLQLDEALIITRDTQGFSATVEPVPLEKARRHAFVEITDSLFLSGQRAGLSDRLIMELAEIFGWDIDFALDIRSGDHFTVVYEELREDGAKLRDGSVLAASFSNRGKDFAALRYTDSAGQTDYYTVEGKAMRKAFIRTPVQFSRISSRFNLRRKHPILNRIRAHRGVDYAAPVGTRVKASGDGVIEFAGTHGGYGRTLIIRHAGKYQTLYGHLSRFARGIRRGSRVRQGQTIAYVGQTGLATGPHLHYEFRVNGRHKDPLTVDLPRASSVPVTELPNFRQQTTPLVAELAAAMKHEDPAIQLALSSQTDENKPSAATR